jgi:hypothetical protein
MRSSRFAVEDGLRRGSRHADRSRPSTNGPASECGECAGSSGSATALGGASCARRASPSEPPVKGPARAWAAGASRAPLLFSSGCGGNRPVGGGRADCVVDRRHESFGFEDFDLCAAERQVSDVLRSVGGRASGAPGIGNRFVGHDAERCVAARDLGLRDLIHASVADWRRVVGPSAGSRRDSWPRGRPRTRVELEHRSLDGHGEGWKQTGDVVGFEGG